MSTTIKVRSRGGKDVEAIIDEADAALASTRRWRTCPRGYPQTEIYAGRRDGKEVYRRVGLHRWLLGLKPGDPRTVDHINRNRLDCRRSNLRICTAAENAQNQGAHKRWNRDGMDSGMRGVTWHAEDRKWESQVTIRGKRTYLGRFADRHKAHEAVSAFRAKNMPFAVEGAR